MSSPLRLVEARLLGAPDIRTVVLHLRDALPQAFLVGGFVRDALLRSRSTSKDLDIVCMSATLDQVRNDGIPGFEIGVNRHGNVKLRHGEILVDVFAPETFYLGFSNVTEVLEFFDIDLNAVAASLDGEQFLDPMEAVASIRAQRFRLIPNRWQSAQSDEDKAVLVARLVRMRRRVPTFQCENPRLIYSGAEDLARRYPAVMTHHLGQYSLGEVEDLVALGAHDL